MTPERNGHRRLLAKSDFWREKQPLSGFHKLKSHTPRAKGGILKLELYLQQLATSGQC